MAIQITKVNEKNAAKFQFPLQPTAGTIQERIDYNGRTILVTYTVQPRR
ncbi:MAG: hypothetical protein ACJ75H_07420 [Thermoanaerobaculia bacterium]